MNKNKVPAYTLMELAIAMLLSGIVIAIAYTALSIFSGSYHQYQTRNGLIADLNTFDGLLKKDFDRARSVKRHGNEVKMLLQGDSVVYVFGPEMIVRRWKITDTLRANLAAGINTTYEDRPVPLTEGTAQTGKIDDLQFELLLNGQKIPYYYTKKYSSEELINIP